MELFLHGKAARGRVAIIDDADWPLVAGYRWRLCGKYVVTGQHCNGTRIWLARLLMAAPKGVEVDHRDLDRLNNRRANLRLCTRAENMRNRKAFRNNQIGLKGVTWHKGRWQAQIKNGGKATYLGLFDTPELAHLAYCLAAAQAYGEFARFT